MLFSPSFIIHLSKGNLQANLLSEQTLHAASFDLEMLPWYKEHELAQQPWMTGTVIMLQYHAINSGTVNSHHALDLSAKL